MANLTQKNLKLDKHTIALLAATEDATGDNGARVVTLCLSLYAMRLGVHVRHARQILYDNLLQMIATERIHTPLSSSPRNARKMLDDLKLRSAANRRGHKPMRGGGKTK